MNHPQSPIGFLAQPRVRLAHLPTPLHHAQRLSDYLGGPQIYIKRDDLTGLATGGNKTRKLEYLIADALAKGATDVITEGGVQSNHCRQTAAAACRFGLRCCLVLNSVSPEPKVQGNLLLNKLFGANIRYVREGAERPAAMEAWAAEIESGGGVPYIIPTGGSNAIGALGYAAMILELNQQLQEMSLSPVHLYSGVCSGGTLAGLMLGATMFGAQYRITGVLASGSADSDFPIAVRIAQQAADRIGYKNAIPVDGCSCDESQVGQGYGIPTEASLEAIRLLAHYEGILLDPVYSSKGFAGMIADLQEDKLGSDQAIIFVHTGGQASLFGKVAEVQSIA